MATMPQLASKLLVWSTPTWVPVREAAKLAMSSGTRDHQGKHIYEDVRMVLSATCDYLTGNSGNLAREARAFQLIQEMPLDRWVESVDAMMRKIENKPDEDLIDLVLSQDKAGKPLLNAFKTNFVKYINQDNYVDREDMLKLMREGIEMNFKYLSDAALTNEYIRWRR